MRRFTIISIAFCLLVVAGNHPLKAFSLAGLQAPWQTPETGHATGTTDGVMGLSEEYRIPVPTIYYAFDLSFLEFFGQRGVEQVEAALAVFNDLPDVDNINVDDYPLQSVRVNHRASALGLLDLKSVTMSSITTQLGLANPQRFVFTLRSRWAPNNATNYLVIKRNFDPVTFEPTSFVNGQLWSYNNIFEGPAGASPRVIVATEPVDPLQLADPVSGGGTFGGGTFYTGLTRDDVGGLRYIYRRNNVNAETPVLNAITSAGQSVQAAGAGTIALGNNTQIGDGGFGIPITTTNAQGIIANGGDPFGIPTLSTNATAVAGGAVVGGAAGTATNNAALPRLGQGGVEFRRVDFSSVIGRITNPFTDRYTETYIDANGEVRSSNSSRSISTPDLLFSARDLVGTLTAPIINGIQIGGFTVTSPTSQPDDGAAAGGNGFGTAVFNTVAWQDNDLINGLITHNGPGQNNPGNLHIQFDTQILYSNFQPNFLGEPSAPFFRWGSFDGTTNAPVVYPSRLSIEEIEQEIATGR